jgi:Lon protease-like protein
MRLLWLSLLWIAPTASFLTVSSKRQQAIQLNVSSALESIAADEYPSNIWWNDDDDPSVKRAHSRDNLQPPPDRSSSEEWILPLYPLPAVYLPTGPLVEYTLNNIEPRNVQMALDLLNPDTNDRDDGGGGCFCAVLRTLDTGRFASTGTILRVVHHHHHHLERITLQCVAEEVVEIRSICNPEAAKLEYRLKNPREYLRASVQRRQQKPLNDVMSDTNRTSDESLIKSILENYNHIRDLLIRGIGVEMLPMSCRDELSAKLPRLSDDTSLATEASAFWATVLDWQTLCNSFQEGHRSNLISTRNEMLVAAAIAQNNNGPLNLPVQLSDLKNRSDRDAIMALETKAQTEWIEFGMNPILDFQILIFETSQAKRLEYFAAMLNKARTKFDAMANASSNSSTMSPELEKIEPSKPRGAWFDDSLW